MYKKYIKPNSIIVNLYCGRISQIDIGSHGEPDTIDADSYRDNGTMWDEDDEDSESRTIFYD